MGRKQIDVIGKKFNHLTVLQDVGRHKRDRKILCLCDCGKKHTAVKSAVTRGGTKSCGCNLFKYEHKIMVSKHPYYKVWIGLRARCYNVTDKNYEDYGGRGIIVCDRWLNSFMNFVKDMGIKPSKKHSVEREDNDDNYTPANCKWGLPIEQQNNKRSNIKITYKGKTQNLSQWSREIGINRETLKSRLRKGWEIDKVFSQDKYSKLGWRKH